MAIFKMTFKKYFHSKENKIPIKKSLTIILLKLANKIFNQYYKIKY